MCVCVGGYPNPIGVVLGHWAAGREVHVSRERLYKHTEKLATCKSRVEASPEASLHLVLGYHPRSCGVMESRYYTACSEVLGCGIHHSPRL